MPSITPSVAPNTARTRPRGRRPAPTTSDPDRVALSCQKKIERRAHKLLDRPLGREIAQSIGTDVWLWVTERRVANPDFLSTPEEFREGIDRKLFDELRNAVRDLARWDDDLDVDEVIDARGGSARRQNGSDEIFAQNEIVWHVQRAIAQLPPQMQRVIRLYDIEGWTATEVAEELGIALGTVRQIRHQAKEKLRILLESFGKAA